MRNHTDTHQVEYHDDGSRTETTVVTHLPLTKADKAQAWAALGGLMVISMSPLLVIAGAEFWDRRKIKQEQKKLDKNEA